MNLVVVINTYNVAAKEDFKPREGGFQPLEEDFYPMKTEF
jgi:hypothetical protein